MSTAFTEHPVLSPLGVTFKTPPLVEFLKEFMRLVSIGEVSMAVEGLPRTGKTTAKRFVEMQLTANKKMVVYTATLQRGGGKKGSFWRDLLRKHSASQALSTNLPYDALFNDILASADRASTQNVLIIIDEAQNLTVQKLSALKKLTDELREHNLAPFTLLFVQGDSKALLATLNRHGYFDLVDRFLSRRFRFRGLLRQEVAEFLRFYDEAVWPPGSGVSYAQHFAPELWQRGWRLSSMADEFVAAFSKHLVMGEAEIRTKFLAMAARTVLVDIKGQPPSAALVNRAVGECGVVQARTATVSSEPGHSNQAPRPRLGRLPEDLEI